MSRQNRNSRNGKNSGQPAVKSTAKDGSGGRISRKPSKSAQKPAQKGSHKGSRTVSQKGTQKGTQRGDSSRLSGLIWGQHAVLAALCNPKRHIKQGWISPKARQRLKLDTETRLVTTDPAQIDGLTPDGAAHQGLAIQASTLPATPLPDLAAPASGLILVLDQITDPHNVGTIFRLAAAFGAKGIIMQDRNAPPLDGATAKTAVGYLETVPFALVTNIADSLETLKSMGWIVTGLAGDTEMTLAQALLPPKNAVHPANVLVLGAEGPGLRPRVRKSCDYIAKIPMPGGAESLNVATAAAIAAYEASKVEL